MEKLKRLLREVPGFPKPGILFYDITTLLKDSQGLHEVFAELDKAVAGVEFDIVAGIESRGFLFGPVLAVMEALAACPVLLSRERHIQKTSSPRRLWVSCARMQ